MDKADQVQLVSALCEGIRLRAVHAIKRDRIPEEWEGVELRQLVFELARESRVDQKLYKTRLRTFQEFMITNPNI